MEPPQQHQQQPQPQPQYNYQYQTTQTNPTNPIPQPYDQSSAQIQSYDQSSYYASYPQIYSNNTQEQTYQTNVDYSSSSSYYYPDYSASYQTHDPNSIHPPGVPLSSDPQQAQNLYYQSPHPQGFLPPSQPVYSGGGTQGGRSLRGRGNGTFGRHGRGRGGTRGKHFTVHTLVSSAPAATGAVGAAQPMVSSSVPGQVASGKAPPRLAWCEVCRVDCNTHEILEQHRNGKKHNRNVKVFEELQNLSKQLTVQNPQISTTQPETEVSDINHLSTGYTAPVSAHVENNTETALGSDSSAKAEPSVTQPSDVAGRDNGFSGRGGFKRKMRGGRGGKWMRASDGSKRPVDPPKPKQVVPLLCYLCNVRCESQVVYDSHLAGKKHLSNVKRFQVHKETFGEGVQALYPTVPNLPSISIIPQANQQGLQADQQGPPANHQGPQANQQAPQSDSHGPEASQQVPQDAHALASMMLSQQNIPDPQGAQAALAQLLNQHGIHDAQTLITQLVPHLLAQLQAPAPAPAPLLAAALGTVTPNVQNQALDISTEAPQGENAGTEIKIDEQNMPTHTGSESGAGSTVKVDEGAPGTTTQKEAGVDEAVPTV